MDELQESIQKNVDPKTHQRVEAARQAELRAFQATLELEQAIQAGGAVEPAAFMRAELSKADQLDEFAIEERASELFARHDPDSAHQSNTEVPLDPNRYYDTVLCVLGMRGTFLENAQATTVVAPPSLPEPPASS